MAISTRLLIAALVSGLVTAASLFFWMQEQEAATRTRSYLAVSEGAVVARGELFDRARLKGVELPAKAELSRLAIEDTEVNRNWIQGRRTSIDLAPDDLLLFQSFSDDPSLGLANRIGPDKRAFSVPVSPSTAVANLIEPESIVDVIAVSEVPAADGEVRTRPEVTAQTILEGCRVLAVGTATRTSPYANLAEKGYNSVTLEVTPQQAVELAAALQRSQRGLTFVLRNPASVATQARAPAGTGQ
jgi:Flp pilus assembly protein CpaB